MQRTRRIGNENGAVLIISLLFLVVLSIIGISGLSNTTLEMRMARNFQHSALVFQAAESSIQNVINAGDVGGSGTLQNPFYTEEGDLLLSAINAGIDVEATEVTHDLDPQGDLSNTTLTASTSVVYKGVDTCPDTSFGELVCHLFEVEADANLAATASREIHVQGLMRPAPGAG